MANELLEQILEYVSDWTPNKTIPWIISRKDDGATTVHAVAGGGSLIAGTLRTAVSDGAVELAWAFESFSVRDGSEEDHRENVRKYGPWYADWPAELVMEAIWVHYDSLENGEAHARVEIIDGKTGVLEYVDNVSGRLATVFPKAAA